MSSLTLPVWAKKLGMNSAFPAGLKSTRRDRRVCVWTAISMDSCGRRNGRSRKSFPRSHRDGICRDTRSIGVDGALARMASHREGCQAWLTPVRQPPPRHHSDAPICHRAGGPPIDDVQIAVRDGTRKDFLLRPSTST